LKFSEFSIPSDSTGPQNCEEGDSLQILVPIRGKYEIVETLCGDTIPKPVMSNGPKMLVEFRGRISGKGNRGFKAEYKFVENFGIITGQQLSNQDCGFVFNSTKEKTGWFHSPNFPGIYPQNVECNYYFHGRQNERVTIKFSYFDVEGIRP
uniref:CUB domain-containing protein n=1 Tax=Megaselia scalaris TaxID=36166 RepID=T1GE65_MEGSC